MTPVIETFVIGKTRLVGCSLSIASDFITYEIAKFLLGLCNCHGRFHQRHLKAALICRCPRRRPYYFR